MDDGETGEARHYHGTRLLHGVCLQKAGFEWDAATKNRLVNFGRSQVLARIGTLT